MYARKWLVNLCEIPKDLSTQKFDLFVIGSLKAQGSREVESDTKETRRGDGTGGNAAREGGRDACGGSGARSVVVRH